jgi:hypothetical protein
MEKHEIENLELFRQLTADWANYEYLQIKNEQTEMEEEEEQQLIFLKSEVAEVGKKFKDENVFFDFLKFIDNRIEREIKEVLKWS